MRPSLRNVCDLGLEEDCKWPWGQEPLPLCCAEDCVIPGADVYVDVAVGLNVDSDADFGVVDDDDVDAGKAHQQESHYWVQSFPWDGEDLKQGVGVLFPQFRKPRRRNLYLLQLYNLSRHSWLLVGPETVLDFISFICKIILFY